MYNKIDLPEMEKKFTNGKTIMVFKVPFEKLVGKSLYLIVYNQKIDSTNKINPKLTIMFLNI